MQLPVVLIAEKVVSFLEATRSLKSCTALTVVYASGLRDRWSPRLDHTFIECERSQLIGRRARMARDLCYLLTEAMERLDDKLAQRSVWLTMQSAPKRRLDKLSTSMRFL
ncbi:hypothetical protein [Bradyrhizobium neotropicale]|uniref:hypothetical protein n=1 Tax=Bradyrhizobium neotropicale TaxID=1497615 RepID=UPI001AD7CA26|nr:hypothetical protein [Bradyrhizobium neotropicale]